MACTESCSSRRTCTDWRGSSLSEDKLCQTIDVGTVQTTFALAENLDCHVLKEACLGFMSTPANLRAVMSTRAQ
jgi:hypothetical protein